MITYPQIKMLISSRDYGDPYSHIYGRPQCVHGGAARTLSALIRAGLLDREMHEITEAGREALREWESKR